MRRLFFILFSIGFFFDIHGQSIKTDSSFYIKKDTITKILSRKDSVRKGLKIIPRQSTIRSALVPGWGQVSNGQTWKVPIVATAFAVNIGFIIHNDIRYHYYRRYLSLTYSSDGNPFPINSVNVPIYNDNITRDYDQAQLNNIVGTYRRYRDFSYLFLFITWAANIVDANVTAHLKTFDISDDITMKIQPTFSNPEMIQQPVFGAKLTLAFK
jgi:Family of unknown function (DUF5683)